MLMTRDRHRQLMAGLRADAMRALKKMSPAEKSALRGQLPLTFKAAITPEHEAVLVKLKLAERKLGGLALTGVGRVAAGMLPRTF